HPGPTSVWTSNAASSVRWMARRRRRDGRQGRSGPRGTRILGNDPVDVGPNINILRRSPHARTQVRHEPRERLPAVRDAVLHLGGKLAEGPLVARGNEDRIE